MPILALKNLVFAITVRNVRECTNAGFQQAQAHRVEKVKKVQKIKLIPIHVPLLVP